MRTALTQTHLRPYLRLLSDQQTLTSLSLHSACFDFAVGCPSSAKSSRKARCGRMTVYVWNVGGCVIQRVESSVCCKQFGRLQQQWGNSSVVERWIPDPAVGGSIPSSLIFCSSVDAAALREPLRSRRNVGCHLRPIGVRVCLSTIAPKVRYFSIYACHPCAGAMLIFSVSFQFLRMTTEVVPVSSPHFTPISVRLGPHIQNYSHRK